MVKITAAFLLKKKKEKKKRKYPAICEGHVSIIKHKKRMSSLHAFLDKVLMLTIQVLGYSQWRQSLVWLAK